MKYRVLFVSPTAELGGAERWMLNLATMLVNTGHDVTLYVMTRGHKPGWDALENNPNFHAIIKNFPSEKSSLASMVKNLSSLTYTTEYDFIFSSHTHVNGALSFLRKIKLLKCKYLISRESTFVFDRYHGVNRQIFNFIYKYMYGSQDLLICQTNRMKSKLLRALGFSPAKQVTVLPNPVNINYIDKQLKDSSTKSKPFSTTIVGCGRLIPLKQFDLLIKAFANINNHFPKSRLVIIGEGEEQSKLEKIIKDLKITEKVILTGRVVNPIPLFNSADIGVISSEIEGFPNVLLEMMASGTKQVITTPCTDGLSQLPLVKVLPSRDLQSIQEGLYNALENLEDYSKDYREYIENNRSVEFFWHKILKELKVI